MAKGVGWISLHRSSFNNRLYFEEPFTKWQAWCDLLLLANHVDDTVKIRGIVINVSRGQVGESTVQLGKRWKWGRGKVERFLSYLEEEKQIRQQKNNVTTLLSILNYDKYQKGDTAEPKNRQQNGHQNVQQNEQQKYDATISFPPDYPKMPY